MYEENITSHIWKIFCGCHGNHFTGVMAVCRIVAAQLQVYVCQLLVRVIAIIVVLVIVNKWTNPAE